MKKIKMKNIKMKIIRVILYIKNKINIILIDFTLARFIAALFTIVLAALIKYYISGGFKLDNLDILNNIGIGLLSWTINIAIIGWLTDYLGIKGINFNFKQLFFGFNNLKVGGEYYNNNEENKIINKTYNAMESDDDSDSSHTTIKPLDKGKGVDRSTGEVESECLPSDKKIGWREAEIERINKWKSINWAEIKPKFINEETKLPDKGKRIEDPLSIFFPKKTNPGPGFNVPGGEVPIKDDICQHIDYNTHILSQYKKMDLETAIEQRNNYFVHLRILNSQLACAQDALSKVPTVPTTEHELKLRNHILGDLERMNGKKVRLEGRAILINSRIEFIESKINKKE